MSAIMLRGENDRNRIAFEAANRALAERIKRQLAMITVPSKQGSPK